MYSYSSTSFTGLHPAPPPPPSSSSSSSPRTALVVNGCWSMPLLLLLLCCSEEEIKFYIFLGACRRPMPDAGSLLQNDDRPLEMHSKRSCPSCHNKAGETPAFPLIALVTRSVSLLRIVQTKENNVHQAAVIFDHIISKPHREMDLVN